MMGTGVNLWVLYLKYGVGDPFRLHMALLVFGVLLIILASNSSQWVFSVK